MLHARCAPSSAERIVLCNGSVRMEALYPQDDTDDSREGEAVHWAGAAMLLKGMFCEPGHVAPNGVVLNVEMLDEAMLWFDTCVARIGHVEETIRQPALHPENWGTPDHWFYDHMARTLFVDDLKYGHRHVEVKRNWQLVNYAALILKMLGLMGDDGIRVVFTIVQSRSYHRDGPVREWRTTVGEIRPMWDRLALAFSLACDANPMVTPHIDACRDCKARFDCEGTLTVTSIAVGISKQSEPLQMSPAALARERKLLMEAEQFIISRRKGIDQRITHLLQRQGTVPFFALESKPGRINWNDDAIANGAIEACEAFGVEAGQRIIGITPTQAIKAGVPKEVVAQFSKRNSGSLELVEDDGSKAAEIFNRKE